MIKFPVESLFKSIVNTQMKIMTKRTENRKVGRPQVSFESSSKNTITEWIYIFIVCYNV